VEFVLIAFGVARVEAVLLAEVEITAPIVLIGVVLRAGREEIIVRIVLAPGDVGVGIEFDQRRRHRVPAIRREDVAGKLLLHRIGARACQRGGIVNIAADRWLFREIATLLDVAAWRRGSKGLANAAARTLIAEKEEGFVFDDRPANCAAE